MEHEAFHQEGLSNAPYRRIGAGLCGSVWTSAPNRRTSSGSGRGRKPTAIKREYSGHGRSLLDDYKIHQTLLESYALCPSELKTFKIPECYDFVERDYKGWETTKILRRFPDGYSPCNILITQRIPPFTPDVRKALIDEYCPPDLAENAKTDPNNDHCLIRPYLGRRKWAQRESRIPTFNLRNFPLHVDQIEELVLDPFAYSEVMAQALAFMHWLAKVDANDVEFVLAPTEDTPQFKSRALGNHNMWILDFDGCCRISMNRSGVEQAAKAFLRNDPYYPRPCQSDDEEDGVLWQHFKEAFLEASSTIIHEAAPEVPEDLPQMLLDKIESIGCSHAAA
ncbi:zinc finger protein-domain-containing protein [Hypoxylon rubiginosum]|uniref:Zinc finger protein-domain-containing protein n=1 Tax=Hypoxylon rubiginosum TaxID=110542 RepID=A0ACC0CXB3_9PEZI|nr:zinc finger protein-domain-containing protein [Hypoxylon rubiginosum]